MFCTAPRSPLGRLPAGPQVPALSGPEFGGRGPQGWAGRATPTGSHRSQTLSVTVTNAADEKSLSPLLPANKQVLSAGRSGQAACEDRTGPPGKTETQPRAAARAPGTPSPGTPGPWGTRRPGAQRGRRAMPTLPCLLHRRPSAEGGRAAPPPGLAGFSDQRGDPNHAAIESGPAVPPTSPQAGI